MLTGRWDEMVADVIAELLGGLFAS